jgi:hypothetical protein
MSGTSQAAPHVTGAIALARSYCWGASRSQILAAIQSSGRALAHNPHYTAGDLGAGRLDVPIMLDSLCGSDGAPSSFSLGAPSNGATRSQRSAITFDWSDAVDPDGLPVQYTLFIYDALNPSQYVEYRFDGISGSSYTVPAWSLTPANYTWRVVAFDGMKTTESGERTIQITP